MNGKLDDPAAVKALGEAAPRGEPEVRQMAVYALGFFGGRPPPQILRDRVKHDEDRFVRYNAAVALARAAIRPPWARSARCFPPPTSTRSST